MDDASRAGKTPGSGERSTTVIVVEEKSGRVARATAVLRPKTPAPTMRIEEGGGEFWAVVVLVEGEEEEGRKLESGSDVMEDISGDQGSGSGQGDEEKREGEGEAVG